MNFWIGKKILVTGGAGLIGSHLVEALVRHGAVVSVVDNLKRGKLGNLQHVRKDIEFFKEDLSDTNTCTRSCRGKEIVFHLASDAYGISYSYTHHSEILSNNLILNANMLKAAHACAVERLFVVSSSCVYPDNASVPAKESDGFSGEPEKANIGYGWSKRILEIQANQYSRDYGMKITMVRPANVYGPRDPIRGKGTHVIPSLIHKVLFEEGPVVVWGSGAQIRNFIHVQDMVNAILLIEEKRDVPEPVNVGSTKATTIREVINMIMEITYSRKKVIFDTTKPEGAKHKDVDISLMKEITGFEPMIQLNEGLKQTIDYYNQVQKHKYPSESSSL